MIDQIYHTIWKKALPYYKKGRPMDVDHIEWMMGVAHDVAQKETVDESILMPLVILHDVGYAEVPKENPFNIDIRKAHMHAGTIIAQRILDSVSYPGKKTEKIAYLISVHDNWAFGDNELYKKEPVLGIFNDLDY